ncbi:MAG TPA: ANTAR domain-containing protein [Blastocatellia bacterium]|nr:ANTAR domain-containing protein [Blastocatellia bacterium]
MVEQVGLAPLRVCIFSPEAALREDLCLNTERSGYKVEQSFSDQQKLVNFVTDSSVDHIVLIDIRDQVEQRLSVIREIFAKRPLAMVAVADQDDRVLGGSVIEAGAQAMLSCPIRIQDVRGALALAIYQQSKQLRMENELAQLREKLAERKLIEKAKGILMDSAKVSESEAFRLIQKQSQDKRKRMSEIASLIISAAELVRQARAGAN